MCGPTAFVEALEALAVDIRREVRPQAAGGSRDQGGASPQFAHRKLETLSDNDLRRLIQTIENASRRCKA